MFTAVASNTSLTIYFPATITGVNTNLIYVFDNNVFRSISSYGIAASQVNFTLNKSVTVGGTTKINLYRGGISSATGLFTTSVIFATNSTVYVDNNEPSLIEMIEQGNYNFTSYVYSNFITGISTEANFPSANLTLKRQPPSGKITINEGYLGSMKVHRFAALSSTIFTVNEASFFYAPKNYAFDYNVFGNQTLYSITLSFAPANAFATNSKGYFTVNEDYFDSPSQVALGITTIVDLTGITQSAVRFTFTDPVVLSEGKYWFVFKPTPSASFGSGNQMQLKQSVADNLYTTTFLDSDDGVVFTSTEYNGVGFTVITERGIVLPSEDAIYNQLNQPQAEEVIYGDESNLNVYVSLAVPTSAHSIKKNLLDDSQVYAIETLIDSLGQNQYEVVGVNSSYYSMIANALTPNIVRYDFYSPQNIYQISLNSLGDYYAKGNQGTVLVSASDFIGLSTIEISTSPNFPSSGTTSITLSGNPQLYLENLDFDFGDLGKQFVAVQYETGNPIRAIFAVAINGVFNYLLISDSDLYTYDQTTITNVYTLSNSIFTTYCVGTEGILLADTNGVIYNFNNNATTTIGNVANIPTASSTQTTNSYIGVSTLLDTSSAQSRKRIYKLNNNTLSHLSWSTQIPEPEITFIYSTSFGLIIGAFEQNRSVGKIYIYYNSILTFQYQTYLRPDVAFFSTTTNKLYVVFAGSQILYASYSSNKLGNFEDSGVPISGTIAKQLTATKDSGYISVITDFSAYIFNETNYTASQITSPGYSSDDQRGLLVSAENQNLNLSYYKSSYKTQSFSNVQFDPLLNGYTSAFVYNANGYIVFDTISTSYTTDFFLQYPNNSSVQYVKFDGQNLSLDNNTFTQTFEPSIPRQFSFEIVGLAVTGIGTIALYNGLNSSSPVVGLSSFVAPKTINWYYRTGAEYDVYGFADGSLREANTTDLSSNQFKVYARFSDVFGNRSGASQLATDIIYNQIQQQANNQALPSGKILEINPATTMNGVTQFVPQSGANNFIYSGSRIVRSTGVFESDPYYASDVVAWGQLQLLAIIPGVASSGEHGTSVTLYVKTGTTLSNLQSNLYTNSYTVTTINNGNDYSASVTSILANISSLSGRWIQFKIELVSASANVTPEVRSALLTYTGAGKSVFVTKTYNTATQSTINPTPKIRRGILTANFVTNGGELVFGYTTDPNDGNPANYTVITPNQIFTLASPSSTIKFGVILKTATDNPAFLDEFAVQLDLGPNDVYFMPPQASFEIAQYLDPVTGIAVTKTYQFVNKTIGIVSSYNWSFGTSSFTIINGTISTIYNAQNPIIGFANSGPFTVGLFVTGWVENNIVFNSELYTKSFIAT